MKNNEYINNTNLIVSEINNILSNISVKQTENLINQIISANRIFLVAIGRVTYLYNVLVKDSLIWVLKLN